jgi:hypothetical protein
MLMPQEPRRRDVRPEELRLFHSPPGNVRLTVGEERSYLVVRLYQSAPLSAPGRYLSLQDAKGEEIAFVPELDRLPAESRAVAEEELQRRYLTARVERIVFVRTEFGVTYWRVETDRGTRDFVVQSLSESCVWLGDGHLLITDLDGSRFEIPDAAALDPASRKALDNVL